MTVIVMAKYQIHDKDFIQDFCLGGGNEVWGLGDPPSMIFMMSRTINLGGIVLLWSMLMYSK